MKKSKTLFSKETKNVSFRKKFKKQKNSLKLELQFLESLEEQGLTYEEFAQRIKSTKGNISRDFKSKGLNSATLERIERMATALDLDFIPLLLPKDKVKRKQKLLLLLK